MVLKKEYQPAFGFVFERLEKNGCLDEVLLTGSIVDEEGRKSYRTAAEIRRDDQYNVKNDGDNHSCQGESGGPEDKRLVGVQI